MKRFPVLLLTTALLLNCAAQAQTTPSALGTPALQSRALAVQLPAHPKLKVKLTVTLPSGAPLGTVLTAITRASGLTLVTRDVPALPVTLNLKGLTAKAALEQLLSLYADQVSAQLIGDTLLVAPPAVLARALPTAATRSVLSLLVTEQNATRINALTGATVTPLENVTILSGTTEAVQDATRLLQPDRPTNEALGSATEPLGRLEPDIVIRTLKDLHNVPATIAYGRVYLTGTAEGLREARATLVQLRQDAEQAAKTAEAEQAKVAEAERVKAAAAVTATPAATPVVTPPAPTPVTLVRRTFTTPLADALVTRIVTAVAPELSLANLGNGTYVARGTPDDLEAAQDALTQAQAREARRVTIVYPAAAPHAAGIATLLPFATTRTVNGGLEVRATPDEQLRASAYLQQAIRTTPTPEPDLTVTVRLASADPATVATQLLALYASPASTTPTATPEAPATNTSNTAVAGGTLTLTATTTPTGTPPATLETPVTTPTAVQGVRVIPDPRTRSVMLTGPAATVTRMQRTIQDLDLRLADVRMALRVEQLDDSTGQNLGVNWKAGLGGVTFGQNDGALTVGYAPTASPLTLEASLNLARSQGKSKTLLNTTFVAQDGRTSAFASGGQLLLSNATTSTGNGQTTTSTTRQTYDYGLSVKLTPRLAPDGRVELQVDVQLGGKPTTGVQNSVQVETQSLTTVATLTPGETLVLGGLITTSTGESRTGVPFLSSLPLIGPLFGTTKQSQQQSTLLITLQAADRQNASAPVASSVPPVTPPER
ncbi:type II secretion system protein GspD [Deinococcus aquatilis]|uniref:type II secretion system protein GspD n=1 Tax=Deinococcus aquatilis TaxID=519440 RepID=UPI00036A7825|nr:secretin N-terminal domain-containing protein [Deinococcus aquatilis]